MATLPSARATISQQSGAFASGLDLLCVWSPVATLADTTARQFGSVQAILDLHGYSEGAEYCASHFAEVGKPVLFIGLPIATPGVIGRVNTAGNTGTSVVSVAAAAGGCLAEHEGTVAVVRGGTVGVDQIVLRLSLDGGFQSLVVRLGTATSYVLPFVGGTLTFGAGTLVADDTVITWRGTAPVADNFTGWAPALAALASGSKQCRTILNIGDVVDSTEADALLALGNLYRTASQRWTTIRASIYDRVPQAALSNTSVRMLGAPSLTFAEIGATGDTITRAAGSWIADGFAVGDTFTVTGSVSNNITAVIASLSATVITLGAEDLAVEVSANSAVIGRPTLTFDNVGETITRNRGSWLADGFRVGQNITIAGTDSGLNNGAFAATVVTNLVLTLVAGAVDADEVSPVSQVSVTTGQTKAAWMAEAEAEFAGVDDGPHLDLSAGRGRKLSPLSGWFLRRPSAWGASLREYAHDLHIPTWRKDDGPLSFRLTDQNETLVEWDDRVDGGAGSAARFTTFRTWPNGPEGCFVAQSLTRAQASDLRSQTHNASVVNLAQTIVQRSTENAAIGQSLILNEDGTATAAALSVIEARVNADLKQALLVDALGEGPRASFSAWRANPADQYRVPEPVMNGSYDLGLNGTVHTVNTVTRIRTGA